MRIIDLAERVPATLLRLNKQNRSVDSNEKQDTSAFESFMALAEHAAESEIVFEQTHDSHQIS